MVAETGPTTEDARAIIDSACLFVETVLGVTTWSKQRDILDAISKHERVAVKSCHGPGKSFIAARIAIWWLLTRHPSVVFTTAPTSNQVRKILWKEINVAWLGLPPELQRLGKCLTTELQIAPDHFAMGRATDEPENLQGIHAPHLLVIADEACGITDEMFAVIDTLSAGGEYRELLIGNPTATGGKLHRAFTRPDLGYHCISIAADQTPNFTGEDIPEEIACQLITQARVAQWAVEWGEGSAAYKARVEAKFPEGGADNVLVPLDWGEAARQREAGSVTEPVQLGLDVARYGSDNCSIAGRVGYDLRLLESKGGDTGTLEVVAWAHELAKAWAERYGAVTVLVDEGYNPGVVDLLIAKAEEDGDAGVTYEPVAFGGAANEPATYSNRRNEMLWGLRELFRPGNQDPDLSISCDGSEVERLLSQIASMRFKYDSRLRPVVESKDEMRKRKLPSPDETDAVALAFARPSDAPSIGWL